MYRSWNGLIKPVRLAKIPPGDGWRNHRRGWNRIGGKRVRIGYGFIHSAVDAHSRLTYREIHDDEQAVTALHPGQGPSLKPMGSRSSKSSPTTGAAPSIPPHDAGAGCQAPWCSLGRLGGYPSSP